MAVDSTLPNWVNEVTRRRHHVGSVQKRISEQIFRIVHQFEIEAQSATFDQLQRKVWGATGTVSKELERRGFSSEARQKFLVKTFDELCDIRLDLWQELCKEASQEFERADNVTELIVGTVSYHLRRPLKLRVSPSDEHTWEFTVDRFASLFTGKGDSIDSARRDFLARVHSSFQSLVRLRPFRMNQEQRSTWELLESLIDVERYWESVPLTLLEIGVISATSADGHNVVWLDGDRNEHIPFEKSVPEFAAFQKGQWFEALVERKPKSFALRKLRYVRPTEPIQEMTEEEFTKWIEGLPRGEDLTKSDLDWTTL